MTRHQLCKENNINSDIIKGNTMEIGDVCDTTLNCGIVRDTGKMTSASITHEIGHL